MPRSGIDPITGDMPAYAEKELARCVALLGATYTEREMELLLEREAIRWADRPAPASVLRAGPEALLEGGARREPAPAVTDPQTLW
jgi:hypothetical protein